MMFVPVCVCARLCGSVYVACVTTQTMRVRMLQTELRGRVSELTAQFSSTSMPPLRPLCPTAAGLIHAHLDLDWPGSARDGREGLRPSGGVAGPSITHVLTPV